MGRVKELWQERYEGPEMEDGWGPEPMPVTDEQPVQG